MMLLLDTSSGECRVTVVDGAGKFHEHAWQADRQLARGLLSYLSETLSHHDTSLDQLTGIGVMRGPGSFTGLRIGMAVLNTLARDQSIAIVGEDGDGWQHRAVMRLLDGENDEIVLPLYGRGARITTPRK